MKPQSVEPRRTKRYVSVVDVFCGAGGLSLGLRQAGLPIAAGIDLDPACRYPFEENIGARFHARDVASLAADEVREMFGSAQVRVLAGCAPCQPFSGYTTRRRKGDDRWRLLMEFLRLVREIRPEVITLENVPRLTLLPLWSDFVDALRSDGYKVSWRVLDVAEFGVPQSRKRLVLMGSLLGEIGLPPPGGEEPVSVRSAIGDLSPIGAGERSTNDPLHASRSLTAINLARIRTAQPAGTWKQWPEEMRAACHRTEKGRTYPSVYGRMTWDRPSPTITTQFYGFGNGRFGHPDQDRALTLREGSILQSFPRDFVFLPPEQKPSFIKIGRLIGNAVPPRLGAAIGHAILDHLASARRYPLASR